MDDDRPLVAINSLPVEENDAGRHAVFTLTLSNPSATATTVGLALSDGTALGLGADYGSTGSNTAAVSAPKVTVSGIPMISSRSVTGPCNRIRSKFRLAA